MITPSQEVRARKYGKRRRIKLDFNSELGSGQDGCVLRSSRKTAVKIFDRVENFAKERECYRRLRENRVVKMGIFAIPELVDCDDECLVVEMSIVSPPYLIDFGKAYLDHPPDYPSDAMAHWRQNGIELFGDNWPTVLTVLASLRQYGIYYMDAKPANICFASEDGGGSAP